MRYSVHSDYPEKTYLPDKLSIDEFTTGKVEIKYTDEEGCKRKKLVTKEIIHANVHKKVYSYTKKMVISGKIIDIYSYQYRRLKGYEGFNKNGRKGSGNISDKDKELNRKKVLSRARNDIRNIINCNSVGKKYVKFVTLTFAELDENNISECIEKCNYEFKKFIKRLNYNLVMEDNVKYTAVCEYESSGKRQFHYHYHVIFYNLGYIRENELRRLWGQGFVDIKAIDNIDNVGAYVCKYLTKTTAELLKGKKMYFNSRGLDKPKTYTVPEVVDSMLDKIDYEPCHVGSYSNDYTGTVVHYQFNPLRK